MSRLETPILGEPWHRSTLWRLALLAAALVQFGRFVHLEATEGVFAPGDRPSQQVRRHDLLQFYVLGGAIRDGQAERLYDQAYYRALHKPYASDEALGAAYSVYPPATLLLFSPLARLPYPAAIALWWAVLVVLFLVLWWALTRDQPADFRLTALLAVLAFAPTVQNFVLGHQGPLWALALVGGWGCLRRGHSFAAGLVLSVLALKPQFAVGAGLWLLLRRDGFALLGMVLGALAQQAVVALVLGPTVLVRFVENLPLVGRLSQLVANPAWAQHALYGSLYPLARDWAWLWAALHAVAVLVVAVATFRVCTRDRSTPWEFAAAGLLVVFMPSYLLVYDLVLLLVPILLLARPASRLWPWGVALYAAAGLQAVPELLGVSPVPFVALAVAVRLALPHTAQYTPPDPAGERHAP